MMKTTKPTLLVILDGFGYSANAEYNAIHHANTPNWDSWLKTYPHTLLKASGKDVGLLPGTIGNSQVGHLTIGSGKIIPGATLQLHNAIDDGSFFKHKVLLQKLHDLHGKLHIMGLLSDGGVHSHEKHMYAFMKMANERSIPTVVHVFLDGRDVSPKSASTYLKKLEQFCKKNKQCTIGSIHGRFYAMDRDKNWDRIEKSYRVLTEKPTNTSVWQDVLKEQYHNKVYDEFITPTHISFQGNINPGDGIIFFNFRSDRARQLTQCFIQREAVPFETQDLSLSFFITPTEYDPSLKTDVLLPHKSIKNTLKEILAKNGKTIFTIAETEKYAHVTYFFNGGKEEAVSTEERVLIPSIKAKNYVDHPEMSARKITEAVLESLQSDPKDFYLINYANADMVGHSGDFDATKKAIEVLDRELKKLHDAVLSLNGTMYVTSDHGNAEEMLDAKLGQIKTSHSTNPVPFLAINKVLENNNRTLNIHNLADIAIFILKEMSISIKK